MKVDITINDQLEEPIIRIDTPQLTDDIKKITAYIHNMKPDILTGIYEEKIEIIDQDHLIKVMAQNKKVYAVTHEKTYRMKLPLYEINNRLANHFIKISNAEIINVHQIKHIDMNFVGTICITLSNGEASYCSRRYVRRIKEVLGL